MYYTNAFRNKITEKESNPEVIIYKLHDNLNSTEVESNKSLMMVRQFAIISLSIVSVVIFLFFCLK